MTVLSRLLLTILGIAVLLIAPSLYSVSQLNRLENISQEIQGQHAAAYLALGGLQSDFARLDRAFRGYVSIGDAALREETEANLLSARLRLANLHDVGYEDLADRAQPRVDSLNAIYQRVRDLMEAGEAGAATDLFESAKPLLSTAQDSLALFADAIDQRSEADVRRAERISATGVSTTIFALLATVALAFLIGFWTIRALTTPLRRLRAATVPVTAGRFEVQENLPYDRDDEIGDLSRAFRSMTLQLAEFDRLKAEFLSMASHDLKTPINVIGGYAELLETGVYGDLTEKQRGILRSIQEQGRVLTNQVNQLLNASRMDAGGFRVELEDMVVRDLLEGLERTFGALADQKDIAFSVEIDADAPERITGDCERLRSEVLGNLLSNAFKFTPEGGRISVRAAREDRWLRLDVADTGKGIPDDQIPYIFDKFYQVGRDDREVGSGLGLAIAKQVIEAHQGRVRVESDPEGGTVFQVLLPIEQPRGPRRTEGFAPPEAGEGSEAPEGSEVPGRDAGGGADDGRGPDAGKSPGDAGTRSEGESTRQSP